MNYQEINKRLAEACGWEDVKYTGICWKGIAPGCSDMDPFPIPDCFGDLNAIHQATLQLCHNEGLRVRFYMELGDISRGLAVSENDDGFWFATSPASDRCEALLKTLELWEEEA